MLHRAPWSSRLSGRIACALAGLLVCAPALAQSPAASAPAPTSRAHDTGAPTFFARINGQEIGVADFDRFANDAFRQKFYHGQPPEAEVKAMLRSVAQQLIDNLLLAEEAERRKVGPDKAAIDAEISKYEKQYANSENWKTQRETTLPRIRAFLETKSRVDNLERKIRESVPTPSTEAVRTFYKRSPELFTEPEKVRVGLILLRVSPNAPSSAWETATKEAEGLHASIKKGMNFEKVARERSQDSSKDNGGDMGYLHRGMLAEEVHKELDNHKPGDLLKPVRVLEGVAIFRLIDRQVAKLRPFEDVKERATGLLKREQSDKAWEDFLVAMRGKAKIEIHPRFSEIMQPAKVQPAAAKPAPAK